MAEQVPSYQELSALISGDIVKRLNVSSQNSIAKSLAKEIQKLVASNEAVTKLLSKTSTSKDDKAPQKQIKEPKTKEVAPSFKVLDMLPASFKSLIDTIKTIGFKQEEPKKDPIVKIQQKQEKVEPKVEKPKVQTPEVPLVPKAEKPKEERLNIPSISKQIENLFADIKDGLPSNNEPKSELEKVDKPKEVKIVGIEESAIKSLNLPEFFGKPIEGLVKEFKKLSKGIEETGKSGGKKGGLFDGLLSNLLGAPLLGGILPLLGGASLILGGLGALVTAFNTDTEAKGTLSGLGKMGVKGGLVFLAKKLFGTTFKTALKHIPIIGTVFSYALAYDRFKKNDKFGGVVELISGTVGLLDLVAPGLGTTLSLGVDIFQAIMDVQGGGASKEASDKKTDILLDWADNIAKKLEKKIKKVPVVGPLIKAGEEFFSGNYDKAMDHLSEAVSGLHWVKTILRSNTASKLVIGAANVAGDFFQSIGDWISKKVTKLFTPTEAEKAAETIAEKSGGLTAKLGRFFSGIGNWFKKGYNVIKDKISTIAKDFGSSILERARKSFPALTEVAEKIGEKLTKLPKTIINAFKGTFGSVFGTAVKAEGEAAGKSILGKVLGFFPRLIGGATKALKMIPFIGSLFSIYSAYNRFQKNDPVGGGIEILSILAGVFLPGTGVSLALDVLNGVLDAKTEGKDGKGGTKAKIDILSSWIDGTKNFLKEKLMKFEFVRNVVELYEAFQKDPVSIIDSLGELYPTMFGGLASLIKETIVNNVPPKDGKTISFNDIIDTVQEALAKKIKESPFLSAIFSIVDVTINNWKDSLKLLASYFPDSIGYMFELLNSDFKTPTSAEAAGITFENPFNKLNDLIFKKVREWWDKMTKWIDDIGKSLTDKLDLGNIAEKTKSFLGFSSKDEKTGAPIKPPAQANYMSMGSMSTGMSAPTQPTSAEAKPESEQTNAQPNVAAPRAKKFGRNAVQTKDAAIDPSGGLLVSSPKVGGLFQLDKKDGIVAGPMNEKPAFGGKSSGAKAEAILERIAMNTATSNQNISNLITGFNNLAKALEKTLGENARIPSVVALQTGSGNSSDSSNSSQLANAGNSIISNFRAGIVEGARFRPA